jgi:hypothetical protein
MAVRRAQTAPYLMDKGPDRKTSSARLADCGERRRGESTPRCWCGRRYLLSRLLGLELMATI